MFKALIFLASNLIAILVTDRWVDGFSVSHEPLRFFVVVVLFTIANSVILPMLRMIFKPFIWVTLGFLGFVLNGVLIYIVDVASESVTIDGFLPLLLATIIIGFINAVFALGMKAFK